MIWQAYPLLVLCVIFDFCGMVLTKQWSSPQGTTYQLVGGCACFGVDMVIWIYALSRGISLAQAVPILGVIACLVGVSVGVYYGEHLTMTNWLGVALSLIAIFLLGDFS